MTLAEKIRRLRAERRFLVMRCAALASGRNTAHTWIGISSNALVEHVFTGRAVDLWDYPRDPGDLARCEATVALLPEHLQPAGRALLTEYRLHVAVDYPQVAHWQDGLTDG